MLKAKGYGDSKPVAINNDSFQNRRIEFTASNRRWHKTVSMLPMNGISLNGMSFGFNSISAQDVWLVKVSNK